MKVVLFVCKGNIHRSVVAEMCLNQELEKIGISSQFEIMSRGIQGCCGTAKPKHANMTHYETEWSLTKPVLERLGIDLSGISKSTAMSVKRSDIRKADVVYAMELAVLGKSDNALPNSLLVQFPEYSSKIHFFGEIEGTGQELLDCGGSKNKELHVLVNERIVNGIRANVGKIIIQANGK